MIIQNVQLTIKIPYRVEDYDLDYMKAIKDERLVKQMVREGRSLTSYGILTRTANETVLVLNYE